MGSFGLMHWVIAVAIFMLLYSLLRNIFGRPTGEKKICSACGTLAAPSVKTRGSFGIELVLWLFFLIPGLVYSLWRLSSRREVCQACGSESILPPDTPMGKILAEKFNISAAILVAVLISGPESSLAAWDYALSRDEMSGKEMLSALARSRENIDLGWPYGMVSAQIILRRHPRHGKDVMLVSSGGQMLCRPYRNCSLLMKFDNKPAQRFSVSESSDGSSNVLFIHGFDRFVSMLKNSKSILVEVQFYREGIQNFSFEVGGFDEQRIGSARVSPDRGTKQSPITDEGFALARAKNCLACHALDAKIVGPAYTQVAAKYSSDPKAKERLAQKIMRGGSGVWGTVPMPPNSGHVTESEALSLAGWILGLR